MSSAYSTRQPGARRVPSAADGLFQSPLNFEQVVFCFVRSWGRGLFSRERRQCLAGGGPLPSDAASKLKQFIHVLPTGIAGKNHNVALDAELFHGAQGRVQHAARLKAAEESLLL